MNGDFRVSRAVGRPDLRLVYDDGRRKRRSRVTLFAVGLFLFVFLILAAFAEGVVR